MRRAIAKRSATRDIRPAQRGMALIAALFLIVVLAALGMFAVRIGGAQQQTVNLGLLGDRAVAAANSGMEYGVYRQLSTGCVTANATFNLTEQALAGFRVQVTCSGSSPYTITSFASSGVYGSPDYVSRSIQRTVP